MEALANVARTGQRGDGRITLRRLEQAIRIRTGEMGEMAA
jgi:nitrogen regulatory protein PII